MNNLINTKLKNKSQSQKNIINDEQRLSCYIGRKIFNSLLLYLLIAICKSQTNKGTLVYFNGKAYFQFAVNQISKKINNIRGTRQIFRILDILENDGLLSRHIDQRTDYFGDNCKPGMIDATYFYISDDVMALEKQLLDLLHNDKSDIGAYVRNHFENKPQNIRAVYAYKKNCKYANDNLKTAKFKGSKFHVIISSNRSISYTDTFYLSMNDKLNAETNVPEKKREIAVKTNLRLFAGEQYKSAFGFQEKWEMEWRLPHFMLEHIEKKFTKHVARRYRVLPLKIAHLMFMEFARRGFELRYNEGRQGSKMGGIIDRIRDVLTKKSGYDMKTANNDNGGIRPSFEADTKIVVEERANDYYGFDPRVDDWNKLFKVS